VKFHSFIQFIKTSVFKYHLYINWFNTI